MAYNQLSDAEVERLVILAEECGEVIQAVGKILRHGWQDGNKYHRRAQLELELGDVVALVAMMEEARDIDGDKILRRSFEKLEIIKQYLHHQEPTCPTAL